MRLFRMNESKFFNQAKDSIKMLAPFKRDGSWEEGKRNVKIEEKVMTYFIDGPLVKSIQFD